MKNVLAIFVFVLAVSPVFSSEPQMNDILKSFTKAILANDVEAIVALYAPDAEVFPPDSMVAKGTAEIRKSFSDFLGNNKITAFTVLEAENETVGDLSFSRGLFRMTMAPKAGGDPITIEGRFSDVSRRINGKWLYITDHASVPLPPPPTATQPHH